MKDKSTLFKELFRGDSIVWTVYLVLTLISLIEVFSAISSLSFKSGDYQVHIMQHAIMLGLGLITVLVVHRLPVKMYRLIPYITYPLSFALLISLTVMSVFKEERVNDASRWIFGFQPSEVAKLAIVSGVALLLARHQKNDGCGQDAMKPLLIMVGILLALIAPENGSTALLLATVVYMMMVVGRIPLNQMMKLTGTLVLSGSLFLSLILFVPPKVYQEVPGTHRFVTWRNRILNHFNKPEVPAAKFDVEGEAQVAHSNIAIASSNIFGKGPGNSVQRDFLTHSYSDYIYAISIEELGLLGGAFITLLYLILLYRAGLIAKRCDRYFPAFLVLGSALMIVCQAMLHMMVSVGLFPVTGQPLPLVSKGGTSIIFNSIYIGMILGVSRHLIEKEEKIQTENKALISVKDTLSENTQIKEHKSEQNINL